jgi:predicted metal-dependent peptidase
VRGALATIAGQTDFTYSHLSRRESGDFVFPALRAPSPEVAIVIDTSGSVGDEMLAEFLREIRGVIRALGVKGVKVLSCDAAAGPVKQAFKLGQVQKLLTGGGGTDMGAGLAAAAALRPRPNLTLVFTDGDTPWPAEKPECGKVIVAKFGGSSCAVPAWAREIEVDNGN